jgi:hypothetical protein
MRTASRDVLSRLIKKGVLMLFGLFKRHLLRSSLIAESEHGLSLPLQGRHG